MRTTHRLLAAAIAVALLTLPTLVRAEDETPAAKTADKSAEKAQPADAVTQGAVDVAGQHIVYTAIVGTLAVGATDAQDAQLGPDGKPQPGSQLALTEPKDAKDATPFARMSYVAYFK